MKFAKYLLVAAAVCITLPAFAQRGLDAFNVPKTVVLAAPQNLGAASGLVTNGPIDTRMFAGLASVDIVTVTNTGTTGGTLTATLYGSSDCTNLTALTSLAVISSTTSVSYTNNYVGSGAIATNPYLLPGTFTTLTPSTGGAAGTYINSLSFTNTGAVTVTTKGYYKVGYAVDAAPRYLYIVWAPGGTATNFTVGATFTGNNVSSLK